MKNRNFFVRHKVNIDGVYEYVSLNLLPKKYIDYWIEDHSAPVVFHCPNCNLATVDLKQKQHIGDPHIRTSVEKIHLKIFRSAFSAWIIECANCNKIYNVSNGWIEPNYGRMVTTLCGVQEVVLNKSIVKLFSVEFNDNKPDFKLIIRDSHKFLLSIRFLVGKFECSFKIENILGRVNNNKKKQIEIFGFSNQSSQGLFDILLLALANLVQSTYMAKVRVIDTVAFRITPLAFNEATLLHNQSCLPELIKKMELIFWHILSTNSEADLIKQLQAENVFAETHLLDTM